VFAVAGLPLLGRYLFLSSAVLALFAAVAVFGWWGLDPAHRARGPWRIAGTALLAVVLAFFTVQADRLSLLRDTLDAQGRVHHDLRELADQPRARELLGRCRPAYVTTATLIPSLAYWTDSRPGQVRSARLEMPSRGGVFVAPANADAEALSRLDEREPGREVTGPPPGFRPVERNRSWVLYAGCPS